MRSADFSTDTCIPRSAAILLAAFFLWASDSEALSHFRLNVFDDSCRLKPRVVRADAGAHRRIDDDSLARFGQWPWPRTLLAKWSTAQRVGVATIAFDISSSDPRSHDAGAS